MLHIMLSWRTLYYSYECYLFYHTYIIYIYIYIHTVGNLAIPMGNTDIVRIRSSEVLSSNQVTKRPDPAYQDLSSFSERATVI